jgi:cytochrome b subunit of formate dehydrogenase
MRYSIYLMNILKIDIIYSQNKILVPYIYVVFFINFTRIFFHPIFVHVVLNTIERVTILGGSFIHNRIVEFGVYTYDYT